MSGILDKVISGYIKAGPASTRISRIKPEDNDPIFLDVAQDEEGYIYLLARKEAAKKELLRLKEKNTELSLHDAVKALIEERLKYWDEESKAAPKIPESPTPFNDGEKALTPNNPFTHFLLSAFVDGGPLARFKPGGWHENTVNGEPQYVKRHIGGAGATWRAAFDTQTRNAAELWRVVERLSPLHGQLVMYLLAKMGDKRNGVCYPLLEAVTVSSDEFLRIKCFQNRGHSRQLVMRDLATCMKDISELTTDVRDIPMDGRKVNIPNCKLFHIAEVYEEQFTFDGKTEQIHVGWSIQAGPWATYYFKDGGRYWLSAMSRTLLERDYREVRRAEVIAFKIGVLWLVVAGGTDYRNRTLNPTVADLLTSIGELPDQEHRGAHWANRTEEALRTALETLQGAGLLAACSFGPKYPELGDRGRGWAERWLSATVTMTTPEAAALEKQQVVTTQKRLPAALEKKRRNRGTGKPKRPMTLGQYLDAETVAAIYSAYKARNWTQETLARELKIARPTLSNVLNKREPPSGELAARIRAWLDSPQPD